MARNIVVPNPFTVDNIRNPSNNVWIFAVISREFELHFAGYPFTLLFGVIECEWNLRVVYLFSPFFKCFLDCNNPYTFHRLEYVSSKGVTTLRIGLNHSGKALCFFCFMT